MSSKRFQIALVCIVIATLVIQPGAVVGKFAPNDPRWNVQYDLSQANVDGAWDPSDAAELTNPGTNNIIVAFIGEGVDWEHEDIGEEAMWENEDEETGDNGLDPDDPEADGMPGEPNVDDDGDGYADYEDPDVKYRDYDDDGIRLDGGDDIIGNGNDDQDDKDLAASDDDENGYPDDFHGFDWVDNDGTPKDNSNLDWYSTYMAGIIAATIDNSLGLAGVAQIELMALRVMYGELNEVNKNYGEFVENEEIEEAVVYAQKNNADVIFNLAIWDDDAKNMDFLNDELKDLLMNGVLWVSPSGPEDDSPCWYPHNNGNDGMCVGYADLDDGGSANEHRMSSSAYGSDLDFLAPGRYCSVPYHHDEDDEDNYTYSSDHPTFESVYCAAAMATGVVALMLSQRGSLDYEQSQKLILEGGRVENILKATCVDITDATGPKKDKDATAGRDDETGFGEIDSAKALIYVNSIKNRWSSEIMCNQFDVQFSEFKQPAIAVDKDGFSHIVYIEDQNGGETFYAQFGPEGRLWDGPKTVEVGTKGTNSHSPDIFVDWDKNVHICWAEHIAMQNDHIYYRKLNQIGGFVGNPVAVKQTNTLKEYLNIVVIDPFERNPYIVYSDQPQMAGVYNIEEVHYNENQQQWFSNQIAGDTVNSYRRPSVDMGEINGVCEIYMAYEYHQPGQKCDIKYKSTNNLAWERNKDISSDQDLDDIHPNLAVLQTATNDCDVYITWEKENAYNGHSDYVMLDAINGPNNVRITYGNPTGGIRANTWTATGADPDGEIQFPKISASMVSHKLGRSDMLEVPQINVIWRQFFTSQQQGQYELRNSERSHDLRPLGWTNQQFKQLAYGFPQIASSQLRFPASHLDDWHDIDGNFRVISFHTEGIQNMLDYSTTSSRWNQISTIENTDDYLNPDIAFDRDNGLHVVYQDDQSKIRYAKWPFGSKPPMAAGAGPIQISNGLRASKRPKVTTIVEEDVVYAVMICYDHTNTDLWYYKVDGNGNVIKSGRLACCPSDSRVEYAHELANDVENGHIGIVWYETEDGRATDIHFGIITYDNVNVQTETNGVVEGSSLNWVDDINPSIDVDTSGQYHIVYQREESPDEYGIYYNVAYKSGSSYTKKYSSDLTVDSSDLNMNPAIRVDRDMYRRSGRDHDDTGSSTRTNRFVHISYCSQEYSSTSYEVKYVKLNDEGSIIIDERDALVKNTDNAFTTEVQIEMSLNRDNQVGLVLCGEYDDYIGNAERGIFYTKLDNNGELLTSMMLVSAKNAQDEDIQPSAEFDLNFNMNVVWMHQNGAWYEVTFTWEQGTLINWAIEFD